MHGGMSKKRNQEEEENPLLNNNKGDSLQINRGVELLLRNKRRKRPVPKTFQVKFGKILSLFDREIELHFHFMEFIFHFPRKCSNAFHSGVIIVHHLKNLFAVGYHVVELQG